MVRPRKKNTALRKYWREQKRKQKSKEAWIGQYFDIKDFSKKITLKYPHLQMDIPRKQS